MVDILTFVPFLSLSKSVKDYSKPFGNCSSVASSSVAEDWADGAPPVAMLKDLAATQHGSLWFQALAHKATQEGGILHLPCFLVDDGLLKSQMFCLCSISVIYGLSFFCCDSVQNSQSKEGGVGLPWSQPQGILQSFIRWGSAARSDPLAFLYHFNRKVPLSTIFVPGPCSPKEEVVLSFSCCT